MAQKMETLVFLDFEATGLNNGKTKITELALLSVQREDLMSKDGLPRVVNKLTLCVNPKKPISPRASQITGLYNEDLESQSPFDEHVVDLMINYLVRLPQPVCLIAHYGNGFDFKLLSSELEKLKKCMPDNLYCADSIEAFRELDGLTPTVCTPVKVDTSPNISAVKASPASLTPVKVTSSSTSAECFNQTTPDGQKIPVIMECPDVKAQARVVKRKIDTDLHPIPSHAKSCRKKLFESNSSTAQDENDIKPLDNNDQEKPKSVPITEIEKDVRNVKKRLHFESEMTKQESRHVVEKQDDQTEAKTSNNEKDSLNDEEHYTMSQSSIPDDILLEAVSSMEEKTSDTNASNLTQPDHKNDKNSNENCPGEVENIYKPEVHSCPKPDFYEVITQRINTRMSYTISPAVHHEKVKSYVTGSDHRSISSYETNHKHLHRKTENDTPRKDTESLCSSSSTDKENSSVKVTSPEPKATSQNEATKQGEIVADNPGMSTPVKEQSNTDNLQETPVSRYPQRVSYKLTEIYKRTFGHYPHVSHAAEDDCITLMKIVKKTSPEFIHWVDGHAVLFSTISPL